MFLGCFVLDLSVNASRDLATLTFDLETGAHYAREVDNIPTIFGVSRTFRSRLISQHLSDESYDY